MKYAEKMVLIPEAEYQYLLGLKKTKGDKQSEIKESMHKVLKGKRDHKAAKEMSQLLGQYLRYNKKSKPGKKREEKPEDILKYFSPTYHTKVNLFLSLLAENGITWTEKNELISTSSGIIENSNKVDLIKEALVITRKQQRTTVPIGWDVFIEEIARSNVPLSFFTKKTTRKDIESAKTPGHNWELY